ncbi:hypothetical protein GJ744_007482 [Endocarpon pusillum]|uniref:Uncharacterized protein n=1 Tax=Endocarpon pusillum TaxID=364733 RepID=A0A8H7E580_9EURO|nr:hypothetical protein GJ744_007482 [Endocarpon pusillum]
MCIITICKIFRCWHIEPIFRVDRCSNAILTHIHYCNRECTPPVLVGKFSLARCAVCAHQNSIPTHVSELESSPPDSISNAGPNSNSSLASHRALTAYFVSHPNLLSQPTHSSSTTPIPIPDSTHNPSRDPLDEPYLSLFRSLPHFIQSFSPDPDIDPRPQIYTSPNHYQHNPFDSSFTHLISPDWLEPISNALEQTQGLAAELLWDWFPFENGTPARRAHVDYERFFTDTRVDIEVLVLKECEAEFYGDGFGGDGEVCLCERGLELDAYDGGFGVAMRGETWFNSVNYNSPSLLTGLLPPARPASPLSRLAPGQVWERPGLREWHHVGMLADGAVEEDGETTVREQDAVMREG